MMSAKLAALGLEKVLRTTTVHNKRALWPNVIIVLLNLKRFFNNIIFMIEVDQLNSEEP